MEYKLKLKDSVATKQQQTSSLSYSSLQPATQTTTTHKLRSMNKSMEKPCIDKIQILHNTRIKIQSHV